MQTELPKPYRCMRCGKEWFPRSSEIPDRCPNPHCHSTKWNESKGEKK